MTYAQKFSVSMLGAALIALGTGQIAQAVLLVESESAVVNLDAKEVLFTINFNKVPDFLTVDQVGRQADSFQYFIDADGKLPVFRGSPYYSELESIIRGEEIHVAGDVRIRDVVSIGASEPNSGGWGKIRGSVPYSLDGTVLKFSAPLEFIGDSDGLFSYQLESYEFGGITDSLENKSIIASVPEPASALGALTFGALGVGLRRKRKHKSARSFVS
ncbi:PEP-CTERM sorting domain-containing protein [Nostoc sp.]|uniref:PEP-CTERM sorting domain-containing protein n=1 Tax=Nostoc sp. TaxID=1180 RepID=UPI002FF8EF11